MAITYQGLTSADFGLLQTAGESWLSLSQKLEERLSELDDLRTGDLKEENWDGESAEAGRGRIKEFVADLDERSSQARRVAAAIEDAYDEFTACQGELSELVAGVDRERASITDAGAAIPDTSGGPDAISYASGISTQIQEILDRAAEADAALDAAVGLYAETLDDIEKRALDDLAEGPAGTLQELIDAGASPKRINDWWNSLSGQEQIAMMDNHPEMIGGLDGIPTDARDYSNRELLEDEIERFSPSLDSDIAELKDQLAEMEANGEAFTDGSYYSPGSPTAEYAQLLSELEALEQERDRRDDLMSLQDRITGTYEQTGQDYFLLGYDSAGDGQAIVSVGNPDTADNTAVYVPGTGSDMHGAGGGLLDRSEIMAWDSSKVPGSGETAVVMWLGYDAPDNPILDSPSESYADDAAAPLSSFMSGLESTNHDPSETTTTMIGHSYGTTVIGHAASEHGLATDQIVSVASPGMGVDQASDLGIDPDDFYATTAPNDIINVAAENDDVHGPDPSDTGFNFDGSGLLPFDTGFGGNSFTSNDMDGDAFDIHSNYWDEGNSAREGMALIFTGNGREAK